MQNSNDLVGDTFRTMRHVGLTYQLFHGKIDGLMLQRVAKPPKGVKLGSELVTVKAIAYDLHDHFHIQSFFLLAFRVV